MRVKLKFIFISVLLYHSPKGLVSSKYGQRLNFLKTCAVEIKYCKEFVSKLAWLIKLKPLFQPYPFHRQSTMAIKFTSNYTLCGIIFTDDTDGKKIASSENRLNSSAGTASKSWYISLSANQLIFFLNCYSMLKLKV